jgi:hypothetical protein
MTVFREVITSTTEAFRSKWSDLPLFKAPQEIVDRNAELEFHVSIDELEARYESLIDATVGDLRDWFWSHELIVSGNQYVRLLEFLDTPFEVDVPVWPSFQDVWDHAGHGELLNFLAGAE